MSASERSVPPLPGPPGQAGREPEHPLAAGIAASVVLASALLLLPPVRALLWKLFSGDAWTALIGLGLLALPSGAIVTGFFGAQSPSLRRFGLLLLLASPVCIVVGLVGTGWVVDAVNWVNHAVPEIRDFVSGS